jgi:hypothetical protein
MTRAAKKAANKTNASTSISIQHNAKSESQNNKKMAANQIVRHNVQQHGKSTENRFHNDPPPLHHNHYNYHRHQQHIVTPPPSPSPSPQPLQPPLLLPPP